MAKKRPGQKPQREDKVPFQIRLDPELHEMLTHVAEKLEISVNQLVQALCWGTVENLILGEANILADGFVEVRDRRKCAFVGKRGLYKGAPRDVEFLRERGEEPEIESKGECWFGLDFSERGVVNRRQ